MNSKETTIQIDVNIGGERLSLPVAFHRQDDVRQIESEIKLYLKDMRASHPNRDHKTYLAMAAYYFASSYYFLRKQYEAESDEAENLLRDISLLCGDEERTDEDFPPGEFDIY